MECKQACELIKPKTGDTMCRSCALPVLISWYLDELQERQSPLLAGFEAFFKDENVDPEKACQKLDEVLSQSTGELRERFTEFNASFEANVTEQKEG